MSAPVGPRSLREWQSSQSGQAANPDATGARRAGSWAGVGRSVGTIAERPDGGFPVVAPHLRVVARSHPLPVLDGFGYNYLVQPGKDQDRPGGGNP